MDHISLTKQKTIDPAPGTTFSRNFHSPSELTPHDPTLQMKLDQRAITQFLREQKQTSETLNPIQMKPNNTALPENLKLGLEKLSGFDLSHVKVHYNSDKPQTIGALAYAQGNEIHLGPGQEKHLPHEAWHIVQQKQGRVKPSIQMKEIAVNNNAMLENEADIMGKKAKEYLSTIQFK